MGDPACYFSAAVLLRKLQINSSFIVPLTESGRNGEKNKPQTQQLLSVHEKVTFYQCVGKGRFPGDRMLGSLHQGPLVRVSGMTVTWCHARSVGHCPVASWWQRCGCICPKPHPGIFRALWKKSPPFLHQRITNSG